MKSLSMFSLLLADWSDPLRHKRSVDSGATALIPAAWMIGRNLESWCRKGHSMPRPGDQRQFAAGTPADAGQV